MPEFQRQLATPNVSKFTQSLVQLIKIESGEEQNVSCISFLVAQLLNTDHQVLYLNILTRLVPLYPTLHRALNASLTALCMRLLEESASGKSYGSIAEAAANLYAVLPCTGGKAGAVLLWRSALEENMTFTMNAIGNLRTTIAKGQSGAEAGLSSRLFVLGNSQMRPQNPEIVPIALALGRLRCGVVVLSALMR
jgi:hypothetical protein